MKSIPIRNSTARQIFLKGFSSSVASQILAAAISLISISLGMGYFGSEIYGIWLVLSSLLAFLNGSQFGIGMASATLIAKANRENEQQRILSISFAFLVLISLVFIPSILFFGQKGEELARFFGSIDPALHGLTISCSIFMALLFFIKLPTIVFTAALIGTRKVHWERLYTIVLPAFMSFVALVITIWREEDLLFFTIVSGLANLVIGMVAGCHVIWMNAYLSLKWPLRTANLVLMKEIFHSGRRFFVLGITSLIVVNTDNFIIIHVLGPTYVSAYAITFKLYALALIFIFSINGVLWPMYGRAMSEMNWDWIERIYNNSTVFLSLLGGAVCIGGILFAHDIIKLWVGERGYGGVFVIISLGLYTYTASINNNHATVLNGMNALKGVVWIGVFEAIVNLVLSVTLIHYFGVGGVALGTFLAALTTVSWLLPLALIRKTNGRVNMDLKQIAKHGLLVVVPLVIVAAAFDGYFSSIWAKIVFRSLIMICYFVLSLGIMPSSVIDEMRDCFKTLYDNIGNKKVGNLNCRKSFSS